MYRLRLLMMDGKTYETCKMLLQNEFEKPVHLVGFTIEIYVYVIYLLLFFYYRCKPLILTEGRRLVFPKGSVLTKMSEPRERGSNRRMERHDEKLHNCALPQMLQD
jgi:hypothetical protein